MQKHLEKALNTLVCGALYVVATPIGNLSDISLRALAVLQRADFVLAEDTRVSAKLLAAYGIRQKLLSLREHNEQEMAQKAISLLREGKIIAQISDAGTPAICDPGARLVAAVRAENLPVYPIAGACAAIAALSVSGIDGEAFYFGGFLPPKATERKKRLQIWTEINDTIVFYEAPHRIQAALNDIASIFPNAHLTLMREISKTFETHLSGSPSELQTQLTADSNQQRGEMVLLLHPRPIVANQGESQHILSVLAAHLPTKQAAELTSQITGDNKKSLYEQALAWKKTP